MILRPRVRLAGLLLLLTFPALLRAQDDATAYTLDLPFSTNTATPSWLGHPEQPSGTFATLVLPITPPSATASLLVTVFFQESNGGFLRISWQAAGMPEPGPSELLGPGETAASAVLCDNFYEGIGMSNQRSLLVPARNDAGGGRPAFSVRLQCPQYFADQARVAGKLDRAEFAIHH